MTYIALLGRAKRKVGLVKNLDSNTSADPEGNVVDFTVGLEAANVVTSESDVEGQHYPVIDLDIACHLLPSTTNSHLFIDKRVPWDKYVALLEAMRDAGLVEPGYVAASIARGYTSVRLPWHRKPDPIYPF